MLDRSADRLRDTVKRALAYDTATDACEISVTADDKGGVTPSGTVDAQGQVVTLEGGAITVVNRLELE